MKAAARAGRRARSPGRVRRAPLAAAGLEGRRSAARGRRRTVLPRPRRADRSASLAHSRAAQRAGVLHDRGLARRTAGRVERPAGAWALRRTETHSRSQGELPVLPTRSCSPFLLGSHASFTRSRRPSPPCRIARRCSRRCAGAASARTAAAASPRSPALPGQPHVYYMGATGGGVWKTDDGGITWRPITDGFVKTGSVGAIAVAPSDPNVIYVGMGEACIRSNFSHGDGVYKSLDAGRTWKHVGLAGLAPDRQNRGPPAGRRHRVRRRARTSVRTRTRSAACSARATAARPGRRCCSSTTRPAPSTSSSIRSTRASSTRRSGRCTGGRGRSTAAATAAARTSRWTAAPRGPS